MQGLKVLFWVLLLAVAAQAQGLGLIVREVDGSPRGTGIKEIVVSNGTLTINGQRATFTTGGGGGGSGDVVGPGSATDNAIARFDTTTGKLIQNSVVTIADSTGNMAGVGTLNTHTIPGGTSTFVIQSNNLSVFAATTSAQLRGVLSDESGSGAAYFQGGDIGTPSAGIGTNLTGIPISTGVSGLGTGVATALAVNTGSAGAVVLFNGAGGTPSSITLTNGTGLPISTGVSGLGTGVATFLATPSSANLASAVTDETGTAGSLVFSASPTFTGTVAGANFTASGTIVQTSASATAFESGPNGGTNPVFRLVNNTASQATGLSITGRAAGAGVDITVLSSGTNEALRLTPKGTSGIIFNPATREQLFTETLSSQTTADVAWNSSSASKSALILQDSASQTAPLLYLKQSDNADLHYFSRGSYTIGTGSGTNANIRLNAQSSLIQLGSGVNIRWGTSANQLTVWDLGLLRQAAGALRVDAGNASGAGSLIIGTSAGAIGTSGAGVLAFTLSTAPTTAPADTVQLWGADYAAGDHRLYLRTESGTGAVLGNNSIGTQPTSGTNQAANSYTVFGGQSTGNATPGVFKVATGSRLASGTTVQTLNDKLIVGGSTNLTDATATNLFTITLPTLTAASGVINFTAIAGDGTDIQTRSAILRWSTVNKGGTYTNEIAVVSEAASVSAGTLTCTYDFSNGTNATTIRANCDTSLTPTSFVANWTLNNNSPQAIAIP